MQFTTLYFVLFFLPLTLAGYYGAGKYNKDAADLVLVVMSLVCFAFAGWGSFFLFLGMAALNYLLALPLRSPRYEERAAFRKGILAAGIAADIGVLVWLKYTNFLIGNLNAVFGSDIPMRDLFLPLGISFYTFSMISWLVDSCRGETKDVRLLDYALYAVFFPKLVQGPILNMRRFRESRVSREWDYARAVNGIGMFVLGMSKKIILADVFGKGVSWGFEGMEFATCPDMILIMLAYTLQIYFDFSGYSDMAIGLACMFGFDFPANFNSPYKADSVTEFWRRWHISLTTFFREYVYFPLGGSRKGTGRTCLNILVVFLLSGLWHGANWTFVLWGLGHGLLQVLERLTRKFYVRIWKPVRWFFAFFCVNLLWLLFRSSSLWEFRRAWFHIFQYRTFGFSDQHLSRYHIPGLMYLCKMLGLPFSNSTIYLMSAAFFFTVGLFVCFVPKNNYEKHIPYKGWTLAVIAGLSIWCLFDMNNISAFIYNNF